MSPSTIQYLNVDRDSVVTLVQVTDTHLKGTRGGTLLGMDTDRALEAVLDRIRGECGAMHAVLATGDLADGGETGAYERLLVYLDTLTREHYWLPGNHDDRGAMVAVAGEARLPGELRAGRWQVLLLDSQIPGRVGGRLGPAELARVEAALASAAEAGLYTLVCLHHQPVPVGCAWLDEQMVADADALFALLDGAACVRGVLWGHVHQHIDRLRGDLRLLCTPSTCVQFRPGEPEFAVDDAAPGFRTLALHPDGRIESAVTRVEVDLPVDLDSHGYL